MELRVSRKVPSVLHLFFAHDGFISCNATIREVREIKNILDDYCTISGQMVNFYKSGA